MKARNARRLGAPGPGDSAEIPKPPPAGPVMNKTEARYSLILEERKRRGAIDGWEFEALKLRLERRCFYSPDFLAWGAQGVEIAEVKGPHVREDSVIKFKLARRLFPWAAFYMMQWRDQQWRQIY